VTLYMLYDNMADRAYLWTVAAKDDQAAILKAKKILKGSLGKLFRGPTGIDEMDRVWSGSGE